MKTVIVVMKLTCPDVTFRLGRRKTSKNERAWLERKKQQFSDKWDDKEGKSLLKNIQRKCRLNFPKKAVEEGIGVYLYKRRREDGSYLGYMEPTRPLRVNIYLRRSSTWRTVKSTLIHELIHAIIWQNYYFDYRRRNPTLFEDYFADELITCIVEQIVLGKKPSRKICREALNYAISETKFRFKHEDLRKLTKALVEFAEDYKRRVKRSDILNERKRLLKLPSPLPETI